MFSMHSTNSNFSTYLLTRGFAFCRSLGMRNMYRLLLHIAFSFYLLFYIYIIFFQQDIRFANLFTDSFYVIELFAFGAALLVSKEWYFLNTHIGSAFSSFATSFLLQFFGHLSYTLVFLTSGIENPYLNLGDSCFVLSSCMFLVGCIILLREGIVFSGIRNGWLFYGFVVFVSCFVVLVLLLSLTAVGDEITSIYRILMEIVLPVLEILLITVLTIYLFYCNNLYLGAFRFNFLIMSAAFTLLFLNDLLFYFQTYTNSWSPAGLNDLLYLIIYYLQSVSVVGIANKLYRKHSVVNTYYLT